LIPEPFMETITISADDQTSTFEVLSRLLFTAGNDSACALRWVSGWRPHWHATALLNRGGALRLKMPGCSIPVRVIDVNVCGPA
jgi:hypothetical protein